MNKPFSFLVSLIALAMLCVPIHADVPPPIGQEITWTTPDGVKLVGVYHAPRSQTRKVWVLLHGLGSNKQEWLNFVKLLVKQGDGFLIYDARGHGASTVRTPRGTIDYRDFKSIGDNSPWESMVGDLRSAVMFLKTAKTIAPSRIAVGGASLGANIALVYASEYRDTPALLLLSPGLQYAGIASEAPFRNYKAPRPVFMAASWGDTYAHTTVQQLTAFRADSACVVVEVNGYPHGVALLDQAFTRKLLDWMKRV